MKRYFYKTNKYLKNWLDRQHKILSIQQNSFRAAILACINNQNNIQKLQKKSIHEIYNQMIQLNIKQQFAITQANHLQQSYVFFNTFHKNSRYINMIQKKASKNTKQILDPNKFPISDLTEKFINWESGWNSIINQIKNDLGFQLKVKPSTLEHSQSDNGLFIEFKDNNIKINPGTLIGFVPGSIYQNLQEFKKFKQQQKQQTFQYLHFSSDKILQLTKIKIQPSSYLLDPWFKNPYAYGGIINHPPPYEAANVCFQEMTLPINFFNSALLKFLPYRNFHRNKNIIMYGIFALRQLKNNEQLFVNYLQNHIFSIQSIPEWLIEPAPSNPFYEKNEYEYIQPIYLSVIQNLALKQNEQLYMKFKNKVSFQPSRHSYENDRQKFREMVRSKKFR